MPDAPAPGPAGGAMPPRAPADPSLDRRLDTWTRAGLISAEQAENLRRFEAVAQRGGTPRATGARPSAVEMLSYVGALVALIGLITLVHASDASLGVKGTLTLLLGAGALVACRSFAGAGNPAASRAAGACLALGAAGLGVGLAEVAAAGGLFITTTHVPIPYGGEYTTTDTSGAVLLGAVLVGSLCLALMRRVPAGPAALVSIAAWYTAAGVFAHVVGLSAPRDASLIALVVVGVGGGLAAMGETLRATQPRVHDLLSFAGVVGATLPLYALGDADHVALGVLAGAIAAAALYAGLASLRPGIAFGAVVGLLGLVFDVGVRNFHSPTELGVFLLVVGGGGIAALVAVNSVMRSRRAAGRPDGRG